MHLTHPIETFQGIPPEDCFFVTDDQMLKLGMGYVTMFYLPELYPEAPLHIYMHLDARPWARNLLFGALLARAEQLRAQAPHLKGRLYARFPADNADLSGFFSHLGFRADDSEDVYHFPLPSWPARPPITCTFGSVSLKTPNEVSAFLQRMNTYTISHLDPEYLGQCMRMEHFVALGYYRGGNAVSEVLLAGQGNIVTLAGLYVRADYRQQGFAKAILGAAADILRPRGVTDISAHIYSRNVPQRALMRAAAAQRKRIMYAMPGIDI